MEHTIFGSTVLERRGLDHSKTPLYTMLKDFAEKDLVRLFVPGHKYGRGLKELQDYLGEQVFAMDITTLPESDNIGTPHGVIQEAHDLLADAYGAKWAHFLVNGTSEGINVMIRSAVKPGEEIIIPRNAHKSTIGGLILSGGIPIYVYPEVHPELGIATTITSGMVKDAFAKHPFVKAVFVINPSYYGMAADLKTIVRTAHREGAAVLVDEAHGAHLCFHNEYPISAMQAGADMSAASIHKTAGSLTQSSGIFLQGNLIAPEDVKRNLNLTLTTSPSYVLMASLDLARKQLALHGHDMLDEVLGLARYMKEEINKIEGLYAFDQSLIGQYGVYDIDETKLGIYVRRLGVSGYELERELMTRFGIGFEMADLNNLLGILGVGDDKKSLDRLLEALKIIADERGVHPVDNIVAVPDKLEMIVTPRDAFYSHKKYKPLEEAVGEISGEMLMAYPPGIPLICPGEKITQDTVDYIQILKEQNATLSGTADPNAENIAVLSYSV